MQFLNYKATADDGKTCICFNKNNHLFIIFLDIHIMAILLLQ